MSDAPRTVLAAKEPSDAEPDRAELTGPTETVASSRWAFRRTVLIFALLLALVAVSFAVVLARQDRAVHDEWRARLSALADERKAAIESFLKQRGDDAAVFAAFPSVRALLERGGRGSPPEFDEHVRTVLETAQSRWRSRSVALLGTDLSLRVRVGDELPPEVGALLGNAKPALDDSGLVGTAAGERLVFAAPVAGSAGDVPRGWVVFVDDPRDVLWQILTRGPFDSRTGESYLVRRDGAKLVYLSPLRHRNVVGGLPARPFEGTTGAAGQRAALGLQEFGELEDYRGTQVLAATRTLAKPGWGLVVQIDRSEALAGLARYRAWAAFALISCGLALVALVRSLRASEQLRASESLRRRDDRHRAVLEQVRDAVVRELSERRRTEEKLRAFFDSGMVGALFGDVHGNILDANEEFLRIVGGSRGDLEAGRLRWSDLTPPEWLPLDAEGIAEAKERGVCTPYEKEYVRSDGRRVPVLLGYALVGERREESVAFIIDLSERKEAENEIRRLNSELEARVEQRTRELVAKTKELESFSYSVSHDLRAPLRAIDGFSRMLQEDCAESLGEEGRRTLDVIRSNARRMGQLIDDLLAFSRASRQDIRTSPVDVSEMVRSVLEEVLPTAERGASDVRLGTLPPVEADPALLRQVFVNLLSNAVKFSGTRPRRVIQVSGRSEGAMMHYDVVDNGVGFDMRHANKLFGVFQRIHGREFEGTGVGLALAQHIVVRHGGTITFAAEPDQGARFTVSLPENGGTG